MKRMLFAFLILAVMAYAAKCCTTMPTEDIIVKVMVHHKGETLWSLVADEMDRVGDPRDIRDVIHLTCERNNISPIIRVGDIIEIPLKAVIKNE